MARKIDPRGIMRKITGVDQREDAQYVSFDCGHVTPMAHQFSFRVGSECRCFHCGEVARASQQK